MKISAFCFLFCCVLGAATGQEAVYFTTSDGVTVRGDLYLRNNKLPFIILCHQAGSNRSEYYGIAPRLLNLNYNCLAIDLRAGSKVGFTENETARDALSKNRSTAFIDAREDLAAAIRFVQHINPKPAILFGSSYSASLCLLASAGNPEVKAVVAFSPGEYFLPHLEVAPALGKIDKQVFIGSTQKEFSYLQQLARLIPEDRLTLFKPDSYRGIQGSKALDSQSEGNGEYWFALMMFFKKVSSDE
jgi:pimeloyl-ACP methyl ester carboxylesterase